MSAENKVYVIDDDDAVRDSLSFQLEAAGYAVTVFPSAVAFLAVADTLPAGCIISDIQMPEIDGLELQQQVAERKLTFPVILVTGYADVALAVRAMKAGAVDFIEKPFTASVAQAEQLVELAERKGLKIMVDHTFLFTGAVRKMKELVDSGELGDIYYYDSVRINLGLFQHGGDLIALEAQVAQHDLGIHEVLGAAQRHESDFGQRGLPTRLG